jgi:hypothetical protein
VLERERLQESFGRNCGPAAEQMMQLVGAYSCRRRDCVDLRLGAPALGDERNGAAHDCVVGGGAAERLRVANRIEREHARFRRSPAI